MINKYKVLVLIILIAFCNAKTSDENVVIGFTFDFIVSVSGIDEESDANYEQALAKYPQLFFPLLEFNFRQKKLMPYKNKNIEKLFSFDLDNEIDEISEVKLYDLYQDKIVKLFGIEQKNKKGVYLSKKVKIKNYSHDKKLKNIFYTAFYKYDVGKIFFKDIDLKKIFEHENKLKFKILLITDLDGDIKYEYWVIFKRTYDGEVYVVYSINNKSGLEELASGCFNCD